MGRTIIEVKCFHCGKDVEKTKSEYNRSKRLGRRLFCNHSCCAAVKNKEHPNINLAQLIPDNRKDEYTPFRFFMKVVKNKNRSNKLVNIDLKYLKNVWENQNGICYLTGWKLDLPDTVEGWKYSKNAQRASLDRIDNAKGYVKGNVRFISYMANIARSNMEDAELIKFCHAVAKNRKNRVIVCNSTKKK